MDRTNTASLLDLLHARRSVRRYQADPVSEASLAQLIEAAIWAPSAVNAQPWAFGVVQDLGLLARYAEEAKALYFREPLVAALESIPVATLSTLREILYQPGFEIFHGAGTLVVIYANSTRDIPDCYLAAENLMLAASAMDLGSCPIGLATPLLDQPKIKAELGVDPNLVVALPIVIGVPATPTQPPSRKPASILYRR